MKRTLSILCLGFLLAANAPAQWLHPHEPTPFRREQLDGRDYVPWDMSFLHRLSYQPMPLLLKQRPPAYPHLQATVGSISSKEFYTHIDARIDIPLEGPFFAGYHFRRDEDFDGTFDWNLVGMGIEHGSWSVSVWGDFFQEKENIDTHLKIGHDNGQGNKTQLVWIITDIVHNQKSKDSQYPSRPNTVFLRSEQRLSPAFSVNGFVQYQNRAVFEEDLRDLRSETRSIAGGAGFEWSWGEHQVLEFAFDGLEGERSRIGMTLANLLEEELSRSHRSATLEYRNMKADEATHWMGLRVLSFTESSDRPRSPEDTYELDRTEPTLYAGRRMPISDRWNFEPNLFVGIHSIAFDRPDKANFPTRDRERFYGKFAPRFEWMVNRETGASIRMALMTRVDKPAFGGGNVQILFPF